MRKLFTCNCCGYRTIEEKDNYNICPICEWEDEKINIDSLDEILNNNSCNNISLFEYQERFFKNLLRSSKDDTNLMKYKKDITFLTVKEKLFIQISKSKKFLTEYFSKVKPDLDEDETINSNYFKIVMEYLKVNRISNYNKQIIDVFHKNIFPSLNLSILICLVSFKNQIVDDFLVSYIINRNYVDPLEDEIINSYWKNEKS